MIKNLKIIDISYEGAGVAKKDGKVVFVPKTLVGEEIDATPVKENAKFVSARLEKINTASKQRIVARCPYYAKCGGCDFQHCDYQTELEIKKMILQRELKKAGVDIEVGLVASEDRFFYRNKIKLEVKDGGLGYYKAKSHDFFEVEECPIASKEINQCLFNLKKYMEEFAPKGLNNVYIRQVGEKLAICFLFDKKSKNAAKNLKINDFLANFSVFVAFGEILESDETEVFCVHGEKKLVKKYGDVNFQTDVSAFMQVNDKVATGLYDYVIDLCKNQRVVNAYSGQGLLTALISQNAKFVYGIEFQQSAHEVAQKLMKDFPNVENICGKVEDKLPWVLLRDRIDIIVLDPAREGCKKSVLEQIMSKKIENLVYISCNFATLTRDLGVLKDFYDVKNIKIFDMFPCTANMETVVLLSRK